ncbi:MAG: tyrosine-type recombinase/integrase [Beijerinckiaceae bacterium]
MFERSAERTKRTGVIPVTQEIEGIVREALRIAGYRLSLEHVSRADIALFPVGAISHMWRGLLTKFDIRDLRFHDLRHEATSRLFQRGLTAAKVMSITGRSANDMVDRYAHYSSLLVLQLLEAKSAPTERAPCSVRSPPRSRGSSRRAATATICRVSLRKPPQFTPQGSRGSTGGARGSARTRKIRGLEGRPGWKVAGHDR